VVEVKGDNKGININDEFQDFTGQILRGEKTIETRPSRSLDSRIGKLTGIIRTGIRNQKATLVGYMVIGEPVIYDSVAKFRRDYDKHLVAPGSEHDIKNGLKYGYPIMQVESVAPKELTSRGIVIRKLNPAKRNPATFDDFPPAQGSRAKSPQIDTPAFKKWFGESEVITRNGKPRIMYHGTGWTNLSEFRSYRSRNQIAGFFAFDPQFANEFAVIYAPQSFNDDEEDDSGIKKSATIYPVYLSLKKVFDIRKKEDRDAVSFDQLVDRNGWVEGRNGWTWTVLEQPELVSRMKRSGFDAFIDFENGSKLEPTGIAAFDPRNIKSAIGNRGTFDPTDPDIRNPMKTNPMDPRSSMTQIEGTKKTYAKAAKMLTGKVIDYGAGLGIGTDILRAEGLSVDSFEPYPEKWKGKRPPTYTDSAKIPSASYDSLVSFSVINVVEPDMRKFLFQEVDRILRPNGVALITGRSRSDVEKSTTKIPHLEEGGYLIDEGDEQRYQKGFTQAELERYAKEVLGPGFTVQKNGSLNGASIKISKGKTNPVTRSMIRTKLSRILEPGDRVLDYDRAQGEDLYRLWDMVHTDKPLTKEALTEIEGLLDDDGVLVIQSGEEPSGLKDHFRRATRYQGMLLVQGPLNPEVARINTEKLRRDLE
jgi:SAM-dependent methyltransferase